MNAAFWREFREAFQALAADTTVRAVVVAGKGRHFTAGLDLMDGAQSDQTSIVGNAGGDEDGPDTARKGLRLLRVVAPMQETFSAMERCTAPVIAAVHGACVGGGIDLITACDIRLAASNAFFQVKEVDVGIVADVGTLQRLPKCIGSASLVRELCYTGRKMRAEEAYRCGLVSRVADAGDAGARDHTRHAEAVLRDALALAAQIAGKSPVAVAGTKIVLNHARDHSVADGLDYVRTVNMACLQTEDVAKAVMASMQKGGPPPTFSKL